MSPAAPPGRASATKAPATAPVVARPGARALRGGIVAFITWLVVAAPAPAQDVSSTPALDQYIESVPGVGGSKPTTGRGGGRRPELPPDARTRVREDGGADAQALEDIATDPALGAPAETPRRDAREADPTLAGQDPRPARPAPAVATGDDGGLGTRTVVIAGLLVIAAAAAAAAAARRRSATL